MLEERFIRLKAEFDGLQQEFSFIRSRAQTELALASSAQARRGARVLLLRLYRLIEWERGVLHRMQAFETEALISGTESDRQQAIGASIYMRSGIALNFERFAALATQLLESTP